MPLVEIDEAELNEYRRSHNVVTKLGADSKLRPKLQDLVKEAYPEAELPADYKAHKTLLSVEEKLAAFEKAQADKEEAARKAELTKQYESEIKSRRRALKKQGYTDDGIKELETLMEERGLADYDAAEALYEKLHPKQAPVTPSNYGRDWDFASPEETDADHKLLLGGSRKHAGRAYQEKQIKKFFAEKAAGTLVLDPV